MIKKNIVLIDFPYLIYCGIFKTRKLYNSKNKLDNDKKFIFNNKFKKLLEKTITNNIFKIKKKFNISFNNIIFVRDCLRETIWRNKIYSNYKKNRETSEESEEEDYIGNIFMYVYNDFFPKMVNKYNLNLIKVEEAEADDIIFVFSNLLKKEDYNVILIANDSDFYQILGDKIHMYDIMLKNEKKIMNPKKYLLYKILKGDKTDNINGLRIRKKEFIENNIDYDYIINYIQLYFKNRLIINSKCIPIYIKERIYEQYKLIF